MRLKWVRQKEAQSLNMIFSTICVKSTKSFIVYFVFGADVIGSLIIVQTLKN